MSRGVAAWIIIWTVLAVLMVLVLEAWRLSANQCDVPEVGADVYLMDGSFEGMRGVVTGYYGKPGREPIVILRTYHEGLSIMVPCMDWMPATGPYTVEGSDGD